MEQLKYVMSWEEDMRPFLEIEMFVFGALCVSYSGQCYMSINQGNRSGNRGGCAQPCRLQYQLIKDKVISNGHLNSWFNKNNETCPDNVKPTYIVRALTEIEDII